MTTALTTTPTTTLQAAYGAFTPLILREQIQLIQQAMSEAMVEGTHYGKIPGCGDKPALLKPGAEKLAFMFRFASEYVIETIEMGKGHREYRVRCRLTSIQTGAFIGEGVGSCSTMESKYRWRGGARLCPECGKPCIKKSKFPPKNDPSAAPGFYCFAKIGGCGVNFAAEDRSITDQSEERQENPDIADQYNTCLKMAKKRASVDAVLTATAASDCFAQDLEDLPHADEEPRHAPVEVRTTPANKVSPLTREQLAAIPDPHNYNPPQAKPTKQDKALPPKTAAELEQRILAADKAGSDKHYFAPGQLLSYVMRTVCQAPLKPMASEEMKDWTGPQITFAYAAGVQYLDDKKEQFKAAARKAKETKQAEQEAEQELEPVG